MSKRREATIGRIAAGGADTAGFHSARQAANITRAVSAVEGSHGRRLAIFITGLGAPRIDRCHMRFGGFMQAADYLLAARRGGESMLRAAAPGGKVD